MNGAQRLACACAYQDVTKNEGIAVSMIDIISFRKGPIVLVVF